MNSNAINVIYIENESGRKWCSDGSDVLSSFKAVRRQLLGEKLDLLCNGSRRNIVFSGMARGSGATRKGYLVRIGQNATPNNLVDIFDYAPPNELCSLEEQEVFQHSWVESLRPRYMELRETARGQPNHLRFSKLQVGGD